MTFGGACRGRAAIDRLVQLQVRHTDFGTAAGYRFSPSIPLPFVSLSYAVSFSNRKPKIVPVSHRLMASTISVRGELVATSEFSKSDSFLSEREDLLSIFGLLPVGHFSPFPIENVNQVDARGCGSEGAYTFRIVRPRGTSGVSGNLTFTLASAVIIGTAWFKSDKI